MELLMQMGWGLFQLVGGVGGVMRLVDYLREGPRLVGRIEQMFLARTAESEAEVFCQVMLSNGRSFPASIDQWRFELRKPWLWFFTRRVDDIELDKIAISDYLEETPLVDQDHRPIWSVTERIDLLAMRTEIEYNRVYRGWLRLRPRGGLTADFLDRLYLRVEIETPYGESFQLPPVKIQKDARLRHYVGAGMAIE